MVGVTLFVGVVIANYGENKASVCAHWLESRSRQTLPDERKPS